MTDYVRLEDNEPKQGTPKPNMVYKALRYTLVGVALLTLVFAVATLIYKRKDMSHEKDHVITYPIWDQIKEDTCASAMDQNDCNNMEACVWCLSGAIPSRCYSKDNAKKLPPGVFNCDMLGPFTSFLEVTKSTAHENAEPICDNTVNQAAGYFRIGKQEKNYFFWFFESRDDPKNDPLVLWMTGGPGCSSELALFAENGPCSVEKSGDSTNINEFSWNEKANLLYIDQPAGTGFSYGTHDTDEVQVGNDMNMFIREFLTKFPQFKKNEFYVFGESYAGHYVPATAYAIFNHNKETSDFKVNLKGLGIGNGLTDPDIQYQYYADMAYKSGTAPSRVSKEQYEQMKEFTPQCISLIQRCNKYKYDKSCIIAVNACNEHLLEPYALSGYNQYDMRKKCDVPGLCYDFSHVSKFLHRKDVLDYLGIVEEKRDWQSCDMSAHDALMADWMKDYESWVGELLEGGVRVLVYAGDVDFVVNYLGCRAWPLALDWSGKEGYNNAKETEWVVDGKKAGKLRSYKNLSFLQVYQAGHMVPMDKPKEALAMLDMFISNKF